MNNIYTIFTVILFACITSCQTTEKIRTKKLASYGTPFDVEWHKEILKYEKELKKVAFEETTYESIVDDWNRDVLLSELGITEKNYNIRKLETIPIENYVILYENLKNWTPDKPIEKIMELDTTLIKTILSINNIFIGAIYYGQDKKFDAAQPIRRLGSDYLSDAYYVKKLPIFSITVAKNKEKIFQILATENLYVYKEDGVFKCICNNKFYLLSDFLVFLLNDSKRNSIFQ